ncbi:MAG: flavin reductase (DIM6/NTAB) family NADH-FMN oxidoreductase RutF [Paraglaciecola sp.]|jgi:flavin reductase (DIM6/NTAB) family NADH-FMN oxidoreductase RutF
MASHYRAKFINSLSGFKSVNLIGTQDLNGQNNLAIFSSVVHLGASPALVGFVMRPDNGSRHTLDNIINTSQYTINQVSLDFYRGAHQSSARYPKEQSEFIHSGLSAHYISNFNAPFVKESRLKYAVKLKEILPISLNNTQLVIGEIIHVICDENAIQNDGYIDIEALETVAVSGLDSYHKSVRLSRLSYAKADESTVDITLNDSASVAAKIDGKS